MAAHSHRDSVDRSEPPALSAHAIDNVRYIRETMERAGAFTAVPGWGMVAVGLTALVASWLASRQPTLALWLAVWIAEAVLALGIATTTMILKARATRAPLFHGPTRRFALSFFFPLVTAIPLTIALLRAGSVAAVPGAWLLLYGLGFVSGGAFSVRPVPILGFGFMILGGIALLGPASWNDVLMAAGFGGLHLAFGFQIARHHGG